MTTPHTTPAAILPELLDLIRFQQEYIVAIPSDVAASLPAMPGFDGDWAVDLVERAKALAASSPVAPTQAASKRLIGWRTPDYLEETADAAIAKNWSVHHDLLPIFEGDVHTKLATPQAAPVAPAPMHAVPNLTLEPEMRAAMQAVFDAESVPVRPAPLTDTFVQTVPDKCDRIVWRNNYYHLPIAAAPKAAPLQQGEYLPLPECDATTIGLGAVWNRHGVRAAIDADRAARGVAQAAPAEIDAKSFQSYAETRAYSKGYYAGKKAAQAAPAYKDSTPQLSVGESSFEDWHQSYLPNSVGHKQIARDAYAAGMGDPLVTAAPTPVAEDAISLLSEVAQHFTRDDGLPNDLLPRIDALLDAQAAQPEGCAT